jgi:hypothetical protein
MSSTNEQDDTVSKLLSGILASMPDTQGKVGTISVDELYEREILECGRSGNHNHHKVRITIEEERTSHQKSNKVSLIRSKLWYRKIILYVAFILGLVGLLYIIVEYWPII